MESVYIETTVVSYLVAAPPAGTLAHQWRVWTEDWWRLRRPGFECVISAELMGTIEYEGRTDSPGA
jgi:hypothetical protein